MKSFYIKLLPIALISGLGIIVYSNTFHCSFYFDDVLYIVNNFSIKNIQNLRNIWEFCPCRFITFLSLAFNYHFHQLNVFGYHLFNIAVHLGSAILVWWLTLLTFSTPAMKEEKIARYANPIALFAGLVFVSHPVQTEAVTYIWQRAASIAAFFYLASLSLYVKSRLLQKNKSSLGPWKFYYICSLITAVAAMFTKENAITLPLMILFYEFSFFGAQKEKGLKWKHLFPFLCTLFIIPLTMLLTHFWSVRSQEIQGFVRGPSGISPIHYFLTQLRVIATYIRLVFLPLNQNLDYDYPIFKSIFEIPVFISCLFLMAILFAAKQLFSKYRIVSFSIFWFFLTLLPESSILPQKDVILEHRLYLPLVGYSMFLVSSVYYVAVAFCRHFDPERSEGEGSKGTLRSFASLRMAMVVLTMIISCNSVLTYQRNKVWKDDFTLWDDTVKKSSHKARPYNNRGSAYGEQGDVTQALSDYNKAIELDPKFVMAYNNRGFVYYEQGNFTQARADFNKAIEINSKYAGAYNNRGVSYTKENNFIQAMLDFNKAIELSPNYAEPYNNRGLIYYKQGNFTQAMTDYNKAIETNPEEVEAYNNRGLIYYKQGNFTQAMTDYNKAIELGFKDAEVYINRGAIYAQKGNFTQAMFDFNKAIELNPEYAGAYYNRGISYYKQDNLIQAVSDFTKTIELNPKYAKAYNNRAVSYYQLKEYDKVWSDVHKAEELGAAVDPEFLNVLKVASGRDK